MVKNQLYTYLFLEIIFLIQESSAVNVILTRHVYLFLFYYFSHLIVFICIGNVYT